MGFLPEGYKPEPKSSNYLKLQDGDNSIRILGDSVVGWVDWIDKKPQRTSIQAPKPLPYDSEKPVKEFWAFPVWNYKEEKVQILEITQSTIQDAIYNLDCSEDWGTPTGYDLTIKRSGKELDTKYLVTPKPPKQVAEVISNAYMATLLNLEKLFTGEDPFVKQDNIDPKNIPF